MQLIVIDIKPQFWHRAFITLLFFPHSVDLLMTSREVMFKNAAYPILTIMQIVNEADLAKYKYKYDRRR